MPADKPTEKTDDKPAEADVIDRIWTLAERMDPCLLVTLDAGFPRARPVFARVRRDEGRIYILTDVSGDKLDQIVDCARIALAFADTRANHYVVISGEATISDDRAGIAEVWRGSDEVFWQTPENPDLRLITVAPADAELWDGDHVLVTGAKVLAERLAGIKVQLVENAKVDQI